MLLVLHPLVTLFVVAVFLLGFAWVLPEVARRIRRMLVAARAFFGGRAVRA